MLLRICLALGVLFAFLAVQTTSLRRAVICLGVFSLICSFCYLLYGAPDVAIAQAVIGSGLSTVLFLVSLKKYKVLSVSFSFRKEKSVPLLRLKTARRRITLLTERFCRDRGLEPDITETPEAFPEKSSSPVFAQKGISAYLRAHRRNYLLEELRKYIAARTAGKDRS